MTYKTFDLLVAWDDSTGNCIKSKWFTVRAINSEAAFADICEAYAEQPRLVMQKDLGR